VTRRARAVRVFFVLVVWSLTTHGKFSASGDEPHYLMVSESLLSDHDFDLANNYASGDGRWFGADFLEAGPHARTTRTGSTWSTHDVGLPALILPVYAVATRLSTFVPEDVLRAVRQTRGLFAYSLVSFAFIVMTAIALSLLLSALSRATSPAAAIAITLAAGLSPPVLSHAFLIFPETPAFFVVCATLWLASRERHELTTARVVLVTTAIGLLPWLHRKYSFFIIGLAFVLVRRHWSWLREQRAPVLAALAALLVIPEIGLHASTLYLWGNLGGPQMLEGLPFSLASAQRGVLGLVLDRERGLLAYAPIYLLLPACWAIGWRRHRDLLVPIALLFFPMAAFAVWSAGFSPAARYLVPLVPLLVYPASDALSHPAFRRAAIACAIFQLLITAVVWQSPRTLWPEELGRNAALEKLPVIGPAYAYALPSMLTGDSIARGWLSAGAIGLATLALVAVSRRTRAGVENPARETF
jgi:hypothetical protein